IRVNAICPGTTSTPAIDSWFAEVPEQAERVEANIPLGRVGTPEDQAQGALWLCGDQSSYVTGVALPIDGGSLLVSA
ncbi:MAG: SDR family NAD(P)-dependent oxidoreductase, partial [Stackebrandtia sp.]